MFEMLPPPLAIAECELCGEISSLNMWGTGGQLNIGSRECLSSQKPIGYANHWLISTIHSPICLPMARLPSKIPRLYQSMPGHAAQPPKDVASVNEDQEQLARNTLYEAIHLGLNKAITGGYYKKKKEDKIPEM